MSCYPTWGSRLLADDENPDTGVEHSGNPAVPDGVEHMCVVSLAHLPRQVSTRTMPLRRYAV